METLVLEENPLSEVSSLFGVVHHEEDDYLVEQAIRSAFVEDDDLVLWWASLLDF